MPPLVDATRATELAGLHVNALLAAGLLSREAFAEARVAPAAPTPIYDLNGEVLFHRVLIVRGKACVAVTDIAAHAAFGASLLGVSLGLDWDPKALVARALVAAKRAKLGSRFDESRFVAYSHPKIAVQFLIGGEEAALIEVGSWQPLPPRGERSPGTPPSNFERWSLLEETPGSRLKSALRAVRKELDGWDEICPPGRFPKRFDPRLLDPEHFGRVFGPLLRSETRELAYSLRAGVHVPCFEVSGQQTNVWCVAASVQMILDFYRYNYDQTRVASDLGLGTLTNPSGLPYSRDGDVVTVLEALSQNALGASMTMTPSWAEFRSEIRANRPLVSFVPGHSRAVAGYTSTQFFIWYTFRGLLVYDPWPPTTGVITRWENFAATTYRRTFTAQVTLAP